MDRHNAPQLQCSDAAFDFRQMAAGNCWIAGAHGLLNSLNPIDHPWNFDSATVAKHRLRSVIRADRDAFPVSRWVGTKTYTVRLGCHRIDSATYERKRHYRWERR